MNQLKRLGVPQAGSDKIASTPAQTAAGAAAQVQFYLGTFAPSSGAERDMLQNVLATLRRLS